MKIALHSNQFDGRGTGKFPYDYGIGLQEILNHEVLFITSSQSKNEGLGRINSRFPVVTYDLSLGDYQQNLRIKAALESIVNDEKVDFLHMIKFGIDDYITPDNCRTGIHCVFNMTAPHGTVYAGVSAYVARKFNQTAHVPHIIKHARPAEDLRKKLGIPADALVFGRHGGSDSFDIPFVHSAIRRILRLRKDVYFVFLATNRFYEHERIFHLPWVATDQETFNFIYACDAMIHARKIGETFGIAVGEFSIANRPVLTWSGIRNPNYDTCHLELLGDRSLVYNDENELVQLLHNIDRRFIDTYKWDKYSKDFCEAAVMKQYQDVFLTR